MCIGYNVNFVKNFSTMEKRTEELKQQAISLGLCAEWQGRWNSDVDIKTLTDMMFEGINFCMKHHWPDTEAIVSILPQDFRRAHAIVANDTYSLLNPKKALITGDSSSNIRFNGIASGNVYVRDTSKVTITAKGRARVFVRAYENAEITAESGENAHIVVIKCSPTISVKQTGNVIVRTPKDAEQ